MEYMKKYRKQAWDGGKKQNFRQTQNYMCNAKLTKETEKVSALKEVWVQVGGGDEGIGLLNC